MIPVYVPCSMCNGDCHLWDRFAALAALSIRRCPRCDGLGRQWAPRAPAYGCTVTLADREPGEIVTLGNGQRVKILWHMPRKRPKVTPETTFIDVLDTSDFFERETFVPVAYPSCVGVSQVDNPRLVNQYREDDARISDQNDPLQRQNGALL